MDKFKLKSEYLPTGDHPEAIDALVKGIESGKLEDLSGIISENALEFIKGAKNC